MSQEAIPTEYQCEDCENYYFVFGNRRKPHADCPASRKKSSARRSKSNK